LDHNLNSYDTSTKKGLGNLFTLLSISPYSYNIIPSERVIKNKIDKFSITSNEIGAEICSSEISIYQNDRNFSDYSIICNGKQIDINFKNEIEDSKLLLQIKFKDSNNSNRNSLDYYKEEFIIDRYDPSVVLVNSLGSFPRFLYDEYIDFKFSEELDGAENITNYSFSGKGIGSLSIYKIVKLSNNLVRLFIIGKPDFGYSEINLEVANIKDKNGNFINKKFYFIHPVVSEVGELVNERTFHNCIKISDDEVLLLGGWQNGVPISSIEKYNFSTNTSKIVGNLTTPRVFFSSNKVGNYIYSFGGLKGPDSTSNRLSSIEKFNLTTGNSSLINSNLNSNRYYHNSEISYSGKIIIFGGQSSTLATNRLASILIFDPNQETISTGPNISSGREGLSYALNNNKIYITGGEIAGTSIPSNIDIIDLVDPITSVSIGEVGIPRRFHRMYASNNKIYIFGGRNGISTPEYSESNFQKFTPVNIKDNSSMFGVNSKWLDDNILDIGGFYQNPIQSQTIGDIKIINLEKGVSIRLGSLVNPRYGGCLIQQNQSEVYILGGSFGDTTRFYSKDIKNVEKIHIN
jgi:hypothetical protein